MANRLEARALEILNRRPQQPTITVEPPQVTVEPKIDVHLPESEAGSDAPPVTEIRVVRDNQQRIEKLVIVREGGAGWTK